MNLPNRITLGRILLIPLFVLLALWQFPTHDIWASLVFLLAAFSDTLDGRIARRRNLITNLGKFLDPLADKMLVCSAYIVLVSLGRIPAWMVILIVCREFAVSGMRILAADAGVVIAASILGKIKTGLQMASIVMLLISPLALWPQPLYGSLTELMVWLALAATIISGADYLRKGARFWA
ncbi:MAG: CDP-diacylglycerol--glycerol-3-phosphate 3-phosphatidyltransferase [Clostridiales bacterium]|nr:CDP-diacylglycerol--glycerol-3-phosphate 3-phosphatidyltransferase [Clostridiales bacterium]